MAWYREWFGEDYLSLYAHRDEAAAEIEMDLVEAWLGPQRPRAVLDLACGTGRHTEALRRRGIWATGADLSLTLLARRPGLPRVRADMRALPFAPASFDWVLNLFTSFGYFESERENFRVLQEVVRVLVPGGRVLLDFLNLERVLAELVAREEQTVDGGRLEVERWYDAVHRRINKRITVHRDGAPPRVFLESVRGYDRDEVELGLTWAGLEVTDLFGNFHGEPFQRDSERLIFVGRKPA